MAVTLSSSVGVALTSIFIYLVTQAIYDIFFHPLAKVPGPLLAKVSWLWKFNAATSLKLADKLHAVHAKYGDVVRIGSNEVSVISPEDVKTIYGHKSDYVKGPWYDAWKVGPLNSHFNERNASSHSERRRLVASAYSLNHLRTLEHSVDESVELLCRKHLDVAAAADDGSQKKIVDMAKFTEWFCYDSVAKIAWGKSYGLLDNAGGESAGLINDLGAGTILISCLACTPIGWMMATDFAQKLLNFLQPDKGICLFMRQANQIVKDRLELKQRDPAEYQLNKDMLYRFIECFSSFVNRKEAFDLIANETVVVVVAGADTTLVSTNAAIRYIYSDARVLAKLRAEITEAIELGKLSLPGPSYDQVANLPYLNACLKEAMRLHPAVAMPLQRVVPHSSASEDGSIGKVIAGKYYLPPGTKVGMSAWTLHMSKEAFGDDAHVYEPERWLDENNRKELERYNLTFGMGSRVCLGKNISMMEMNKLIPVLVHNYDLEMVNPVEPYRTTQCWFTVQKDFLVKVSKREGMDD